MEKIVKFIGIMFIIVIITIIVLFKFKKEDKAENKNVEIENSIKKISTIQEIPDNITTEDAIKMDYFVYDCSSNNVYNMSKLKTFVENTRSNNTNRQSDEIILVIYNMSGDPIIYYIIYDSVCNKYFLAMDYTRIEDKHWEESKNEIPQIANEIFYNTDIPGNIYTMKVTKDIEFNVAIISLNVFNNTENNKYQNIEIGRYMLDANIIEE